MQNKFIVYNRFSELATLEHFTGLLQQHNIPFETENNAPSLDNTFGRNDFAVYYFVKILKDDFSKADKIQEDDALQSIHQLEEDYYLYDFSDEELLEIIENKEEWSTLDFVMAKKLLKDKGVMSASELEDKIKEAESPNPTTEEKPWMIFGYIFTFLFGGFGVFKNMALLTSKKEAKNGSSEHTYSEETRKKAKYAILFGIILFLVVILYKYYVVRKM